MTNVTDENRAVMIQLFNVIIMFFEVEAKFNRHRIVKFKIYRYQNPYLMSNKRLGNVLTDLVRYLRPEELARITVDAINLKDNQPKLG